MKRDTKHSHVINVIMSTLMFVIGLVEMVYGGLTSDHPEVLEGRVDLLLAFSIMLIDRLTRLEEKTL